MLTEHSPWNCHSTSALPLATDRVSWPDPSWSLAEPASTPTEVAARMPLSSSEPATLSTSSGRSGLTRTRSVDPARLTLVNQVAKADFGASTSYSPTRRSECTVSRSPTCDTRCGPSAIAVSTDGSPTTTRRTALPRTLIRRTGSGAGCSGMASWAVASAFAAAPARFNVLSASSGLISPEATRFRRSRRSSFMDQ